MTTEEPDVEKGPSLSKSTSAPLSFSSPISSSSPSSYSLTDLPHLSRKQTFTSSNPSHDPSNEKIPTHESNEPPLIKLAKKDSASCLPTSPPLRIPSPRALSTDTSSTQHVTKAACNSSANRNPPRPSLHRFPSTTSVAPSALPIPDGGLRAWLAVAGSFAATTAGFGLINSVGVLQAHLESHQLAALAPRDVAWIPATNVFLCLALGVQVGPWFDRHGPRGLMAGGSVVFVAALVAMSFLDSGKAVPDADGWETTPPEGPPLARTYALLMLTWGVLCGCAAAVVCTTALAVVAHWFDARRGLAVGIVFVGSSVGGVGFPLVLRATLETLGWAWSMRVVALIVAVLLALGNLLIRGRVKGGKGAGAISLRCFRDGRFVWATVGIALFEFVLVGSLGMLPTWARAMGFEEETAFNVVAVMNGGSGVGRLVAGAVSDYIGRFNTMILTLIWSLLVVFGLWLAVHPDRTWLFYIFAPLFGFGSGSIISMAPVCIGQLCKPTQFGQFFGTSYSVVSLAALLCMPLSAEVLHDVGTQWFVVVFGGVLILALLAICMARLATLEYRWRWTAVV